jgi:asparagine synthetase B (glutamine-hydrolysing)
MPNSYQYYINKNFPSYKPLFNKVVNPYAENYSKLISRDKNYNFVHGIIKKYFELFDDPINAMGYIDFKLIMPGLLQMADRMSSSLGIENRCPFLDKRIIEFGFSLPPELKINGFIQKKILFDLLIKKNKKKYKTVNEKKGLSFNIKHWYTVSDQNRQKYFKSLNIAWKKAFQF